MGMVVIHESRHFGSCFFEISGLRDVIREEASWALDIGISFDWTEQI